MIIQCHLFLNLPEGKAPFIGVTYNYDAFIYAEVLGAELLLMKDPYIDLILEVKESLLHITLYVRGTEIQKCYKCTFDPVTFHEWLYKVRDSKEVNFGHVIKSREGKYQIAKATKMNKSFYLPVKRLLIIDSRAEQVVSITTKYPPLKKVS